MDALHETLDVPCSGEIARAQLFDGRYELAEPVGRGGGGIVYRARDVILDRPIALKVIGLDHDDGRAAGRARREACALGRLRHVNVVQVYAQGMHDGAYWIAMEYIDGRDLASLVVEEVGSRGTLPVDHVMAILRQVARGLDAIHDHGLVHLDVKPANIMIETRSGRGVLVDFGLARERVRAWATSIVGGTPSYMAPEQATSSPSAEIGPRTDVYAFGCTAFELLAGVPPFVATSAFQLLMAHRHSDPPRLSSLKPKLAALDGVLARAMAKCPAARPSSCEELVDQLESALRCSQRVTLQQLPPQPTRGSPDVLHIVIFACEETKACLETQLRHVVAATGDSVEIECVDSCDALFSTLARATTDAILVDADLVKGREEVLLDGLRHAPLARDAQVVVVGNSARRAGYTEIGARELPKPILPHVLRKVIARVMARTVELRAERGAPALAGVGT